MSRYKYKAINEYGKCIKGSTFAENHEELEIILQSSKLNLISCSLDKGISFLGSNLSDKEMIVIFSHLEQFDRCGISIVDSIADLKESSDSMKIRNLMQEIHETLKNGSMISESFAKHPKTFKPIFIGLISTGEKTGNLHDAFSSILYHLKWSMDMKKKTVKAIRYPIFSLIVMLIVVGIMTTFVVPKVTDFLKSQHIELPATTTALMAFSEFVQGNGLLMIIFVPILIITYKVLTIFPNIAVKIDQIKLYIPIFGKIMTKIDASRFCHFFAITFKSGLGVLECLDASKTVISNRAIKQSIDVAKHEVSNGHRLSESIAHTKYFPQLVVKMFDMGETSGNMEESLGNIRYFYDQEINDSIEKIVGMIQPSLTLIMGGMMAWITIAVFGPIYGSFGQF